MHHEMRLITIAGAVLMTAATAFAHQAPRHEHAALVPIPPYQAPFGSASGQAAFEAARAYLASLSTEERSATVLDLDADIRTKWSNLPASFVTRGGVKLGELSDTQIELLFAFLASSLGQEGYEAVGEALAAEAFLSTDARAERFQWAPENYWFAFYGEPSETALWGWQFGGHHLGINVAIEKSVVTSLSPTFVGAEPATFTYKGQDYEAVQDMHRAGITLFEALTPAQQAAATLETAPRDVITGPGKDGFIPPAEGSPVAGWSVPQKALLLDAIREWVTIQPEENATPRMKEIASQLDATNFCWFGAADGSGESYYRIQGPTLIIELRSITNNVGDSAEDLGHYHTIYRNPTLEYGSESTQPTN